MGRGYSVAWRVYDAQYWGVPQRRKRIYLIADFGSERAGEILFERDGLPGNLQQGNEAREGASADAGGSADADHRGGVKSSIPTIAFHLQQDPITEEECAPCIGGQHQATVGVCGVFMGGQGAKAGSIAYSESTAPTLKSVLSGGNTIPEVVYPATARTLTARHDSSPCVDRGENIVVIPIHDKATRSRGGGEERKDDGSGNDLGIGEANAPGYTLTAADRHAVCYDCFRKSGYGEFVEDRTAASIRSSGGDAGGGSESLAVCYDARGNGSGAIVPNLTGDHENRVTDYTALCVEQKQRYTVRRLTPTECARLQGFPDTWGRIAQKKALTAAEEDFWRRVRREKTEIDGKQPKEWTSAQMLAWYNRLWSESAEYKMWGNGIALPCAKDVLRRVAGALGKGGAEYGK